MILNEGLGGRQVREQLPDVDVFVIEATPLPGMVQFHVVLNFFLVAVGLSARAAVGFP